MLKALQSAAAGLAELPELVRGSARELRSLRSLTGGSMLAALSVILNQFTIFFSQLLRLSFTFLAIGVSGMLFGPVLTGALGAVTDVLKYLVRNDGGFFFPGFTLNEFLRGFLYGLFLYRRPVTFGRVFAAQLSILLTITLLLNPLWLSLMYGQAFWALVSMRLVKNLILLPVESAMLFFLLKKVAALRPIRMA